LRNYELICHHSLLLRSFAFFNMAFHWTVYMVERTRCDRGERRPRVLILDLHVHRSQTHAYGAGVAMSKGSFFSGIPKSLMSRHKVVRFAYTKAFAA